MVVAPLMARSWWKSEAKEMPKQILFVGTGAGSKGIYAFNWDPEHGTLDGLVVAAEADTPSFLALSPDRKHLFAVNEVDNFEGKPTGAVSSYAIERSGDGAKLTLINTVASGGKGPCHLAVDHTGKALFVANYTGGSAASFQIAPGGKLSDAVSEFHYSGHGADYEGKKARQEAPHAHRATVSPNNRFVMINDLGLDRIHIYRMDAATAKLTPNDPPDWKASPGSGPRALRFHPSGRWAYCVNELKSTVDQLNWDSSSGALTQVDQVSLLPEGFKGETRASDIVFDSKGDFAYVANRDDDFLAGFHVDEATGKLSSLRRSPCGGKTPRELGLDPTGGWILVANQDSNLVAVYRRDKKTGKLASNGQSFPVQTPECLVFY